MMASSTRVSSTSQKGARNKFHTHENDPILVVTEGTGIPIAAPLNSSIQPLGGLHQTQKLLPIPLAILSESLLREFEGQLIVSRSFKG